MLSGKRATIIITDDLSDFTLDERSDHAEAALDAYQSACGTSGSDRQDIKELICDLLHLLDDLQLERGEHDEPPYVVLGDALEEYRDDLAG